MPPRFGRKIGDRCSGCNHGNLIPVLREIMPVRNGAQPAGNILDPVIERLACHLCSMSFEAADRGRPIREVREETFGQPFENPLHQPNCCELCEGTTHKRATHFPHGGAPVVHYLHCTACHTVLWTFDAPEIVKPEESAPAPVMKRLEPVTGQNAVIKKPSIALA